MGLAFDFFGEVVPETAPQAALRCRRAWKIARRAEKKARNDRPGAAQS
jgi:hypothetical protein